MSETPMRQKPKRPRPGAKLKAGVETVFIGCKGPADLRERLRLGAKHLGLDSSEVLRALIEDFACKVEKLTKATQQE